MFKFHDANIDAASVDAFLVRADADFFAHRMNDAANGYQRVLAARPYDAHALHRMALALVHMNEIGGASAYMERAVLAAPGQANLWEQAGLIAAMKGELVQAETYYHRAMAIGGSTATLHRNLADCLRQSDRLHEAKAHYGKALEMEPELHHAIRAIGRISAELAEPDDAANYLLRAWKLPAGACRTGLT